MDCDTFVSEFASLDATAMAALVATGECTALEQVDAAIERIEAVDGTVNAVIHRRFERAREEAAGPLPAGPFRGVPLCVKDAVCQTEGDPYHLGMRFLHRRQWRATADTELARRFRRAGFVLVGRTNVPEMAGSATTEPLLYGATRNPWDTDRSPGGSSGGSAAAVAAGMVPVAHGNDMGGSIRIPAAACGLVGLKPTRARTSLGPHVGELWGPLTSEGVLTRTVRDTAAVLDAIAGPAVGDPYTAPPPVGPFAEALAWRPHGLRIGVRTSMPDAGTAAPEACAAVSLAAALLTELGHHLDDSSPAALDNPSLLDGYPTVVGVGMARDVERLERLTGDVVEVGELEPLTWQRVEFGRGSTALEYAAAVENLHTAARRVRTWWADGHDLLLTPALGSLPPRIGEAAPTAPPETLRAVHTALAGFTRWVNATGQPAIVVPVGVTASGLPVAVQLVAEVGGEQLLLAVAAQIEEATGWPREQPRIAAEHRDGSHPS